MVALPYLLRRGSGAGSSQQRMRERELVLPRTGRGHGEDHAAHADPHQRADLQQFQPDRAAGRRGKLRVRQADAAQGSVSARATTWIRPN